MIFNISGNSEHAYIVGLLQADGNLCEYKNKGKLSIELKSSDRELLEKINIILESHIKIRDRERDIKINKYQYHAKSSILSVYDLNFRNTIRNYLPQGKKSSIIEKPLSVIEIDYWRGIIDGDGSLGITKNNIPFISLVTCSDILAQQFVDFIAPIIGYRKTFNRNKRDNAFNIMITCENAMKIVQLLYYDNCLALERKRQKSIEIINWIRPDNRKKYESDRKKWNDFEDDYIFTHDMIDSMDYLDRSEDSIKMRLYRLKLKQSN